VTAHEVTLQVHSYDTDLTREHFLHFVTNEAHPEPGLIAGFLRLSLPLAPGVGSRAFLDEIAESALIREVHVYGPALGIDAEGSDGAAQHTGLGTRLLDAARRISHEAGFRRISVIAATGTRAYYAARGFEQGELYMSGDC
jgi:elongator complex protein 3